MSEESELMEALFAAATGHAGAGGTEPADLWPAFLDRLARAVSADGLSLAAIHQDRVSESWHVGQLPAPPATADIGRMRWERVYSHVDLPGADRGRTPVRALRCPMPSGGAALLLAERRGQDFRAVDGVRLAGLGPYVAQALAGWRALRVERANAALDRAATRALGVGWLVLNPAGRVLSAAPWVAGELLARAGLRLRGDGWLDFADDEMAQGFGRALAAAQAEASGAGDPAPVVPTRDAAIRIAIRAGEHLGAGVLVAWLRWQRPLRGLPPERLAAAFGLSRSEARLAARIADGMSLRQAAADLGWTIETARSASKQLFARMGVDGQTGVIRELLASPVWLAVRDAPA